MKKIFSVIILLTLLLKVAAGQENQLDTLVKKFEHYRVKALQEKMYAHLDRTFYLTGETLWFKVYTVDGSFHKPLNVSRVAYVEILDRANLPVLQAKIELTNGSGNGSLFLPASLNSGIYTFRVYTNWMKNFSPAFYFTQDFTIVNPFVKPESEQRVAAKVYTADFFPEGGNLVTGIPGKVAFKISDSAGKGVSCKGFVLNQHNDTITSFAPTKFGIGHFLFTPSAEAQYKVILRDEQNITSQHPFTEVQKSGYVMQLRDSGEFLKINVAVKDDETSFVYLFVHARQVMVKAEMQSLRRNMASFTVEKRALPDGISHFTVFNDDQDPVCERLYFTYPQKTLEIDLAGNQKEYTFRRKVTVSIQTKSDSNTPTPANLSMAVFKMDSLSTDQQIGIFQYLWLGSDLTGTIESPEYYFSNPGPGVSEAMDNLMLTHGWRRFNWKEVLEKRGDPDHLPEHNGHIITGLVTRDGEAQRGILTYLASPGNIIRVYGSRSNNRGEVRFEVKDFYGPQQVIIQTQTDSAMDYRVNINNPFSPVFDQRQLPELKISAEAEKTLLSRSIAMQVQDIFYYESYGNRFISPLVDSSAFYGKADATYYLDDYTRFQVMEEVMREYVPGVFVRKRKGKFHFMLVDIDHGGILNGDPMVLIDGVPVFEVDDIMKFDPLKVKKLEVVKRQYYLGPAVFSGIVSYSTYAGDLAGWELDPRSISLNYDGLQLRREFYSPIYNNNEQRNNRMPDQRYLLYWDPEITTGRDGKQQVEFYTSDVPGTYRVIVEGLNNQGLSGSKVYTFSVKPPDNQ